MININSIVIILPLITATENMPTNKFSQTIPYSSFSVEKPKLKNTMDFNTIRSEEFIRDNNEKILQKLRENSE